ncbi:hypothetical protein APHAL10511_000228 [Amanita phalloides]|nr:hypothetical protein APHAL10511_000228 [Amanita phalloides]
MDTGDDAAAASTINEHLTFPSASTDSAEPAPYAPPQPRVVLKDRLYVGNLHPSVDEYTLLQVFSKFGKITKLDFLFHKTGALKGKPRGYAFVEYGEQADALKALTKAHEKLLRGRKLIVTYAHQAPLEQDVSSASLRHRKTVTEAGRPTTLSLIKSGLNNRRHARTEDKIALMEAKLRQLGSSGPTSGASMATPPLLHPSLPAKPALPLGQMTRSVSHERPKGHSSTPLPSSLQTPPQTPSQIRSRQKLAGVKILKPKDSSGSK